MNSHIKDFCGTNVALFSDFYCAFYFLQRLDTTRQAHACHSLHDPQHRRARTPFSGNPLVGKAYQGALWINEHQLIGEDVLLVANPAVVSLRGPPAEPVPAGLLQQGHDVAEAELAVVVDQPRTARGVPEHYGSRVRSAAVDVAVRRPGRQPHQRLEQILPVRPEGINVAVGIVVAQNGVGAVRGSEQHKEQQDGREKDRWCPG